MREEACMRTGNARERDDMYVLQETDIKSKQGRLEE